MVFRLLELDRDPMLTELEEQSPYLRSWLKYEDRELGGRMTGD